MEITLKDKATGGSTSITLKVAEESVAVDDSDELIGVPRITESRAPALPPRRASGAVSFTDQDPEVDLVWTQDSWHKGALRPYWRPDDPEHYSLANGVDLRFEGLAALFPPPSGQRKTSGLTWSSPESMPVIVQDPGFEADNGKWTQGTGVTQTFQATDPVLGTNSLKLETDGGRSNNDILTSITVPLDHTPLQGRNVNVSAVVRRVSGTNGIKMFMDDGVTVTVDSTPTTSSSYERTLLSNITVDASATKLQIGLKQDGGNAAVDVFHVDIVQITAVETGEFIKSTTLSGITYAIGGQDVYSWDETNARWRFEFGGAATATDITAFNGNVYIAYGFSDDYVYGTSGSWTASSRSAPDDKAKFWAISKNASGASALWKSETDTALANTTDGTNGAAAWTAPLSVGDTDAIITALYGSFDTIVVGKTDALWGYTRFDPNTSAGDNLFQAITSLGAGTLISMENFDKGVEFAGWLWLRTAGQGLIRWRPGELQHVQTLFTAARVGNFGLKIYAIATDQRQLYLVLGSSSIRYLVSIVPLDDGKLALHLLAKVPMITTANTDVTHLHIDTTNEAIYVMGSDYPNGQSESIFGPAIWRYHLDNNQPAQFQSGFDMDDAAARTGSFDTSIYHASIPTREKAFLALTIWGEDISSTATIVVKYGLNGEDPSTKTLGTFNGTGAIQTLYFHTVSSPETNAIGNTIQLQFTLTLPASSTGTTVGPRLFAFGLHSTLNTERFRLWEIDVEATEEIITDAGLAAPESHSDILAALNTLELQTYPIVMLLDVDEDGVDETITVHLRDVRRSRTDEGAERITLLLQEAKTSS